MSWTEGDYDWEDQLYLDMRDKLADLIPELDQYFDEVRQDDHDGSCWDLINGLAMLLTHRDRTANK